MNFPAHYCITNMRVPRIAYSAGRARKGSLCGPAGKENIEMFPEKKDVIKTMYGDAKIPGLYPNFVTSILENRNISGELFAIYSALDYCNKRGFKRVAIVTDLEVVALIAKEKSLVEKFPLWGLNTAFLNIFILK